MMQATSYTSKGLPCKGIDVFVWKTLSFFFWYCFSLNGEEHREKIGRFHIWVSNPTPSPSQIMKPLNSPNNAENPVSNASHRFFQIPVQSPKLPTWSLTVRPWKYTTPKGKVVLQPSIFRCYVSFRDGNYNIYIYIQNPMLGIPDVRGKLLKFTSAEREISVTCMPNDDCSEGQVQWVFSWPAQLPLEIPKITGSSSHWKWHENGI